VDRRYTRRPFTVAVCAACDSGPDSALLQGLRAVIGECPHGMLVTTQCLLGGLTCAARGPHAGEMLLLQPCTPDRVPTASVQWIGPVTSEVDAEAACAWIADGSWDRARLPMRLRADLNLTRSSRRN
jgi:hypothetical protein